MLSIKSQSRLFVKVHLNISEFGPDVSTVLVIFLCLNFTFIIMKMRLYLGVFSTCFRDMMIVDGRWSVIESCLYYLIKDQNCMQDWDMALSNALFIFSSVLWRKIIIQVFSLSRHIYIFIIYIFCLYLIIFFHLQSTYFTVFSLGTPFSFVYNFVHWKHVFIKALRIGWEQKGGKAEK